MHWAENASGSQFAAPHQSQVGLLLEIALEDKAPEKNTGQGATRGRQDQEQGQGGMIPGVLVGSSDQE